MLLPMPKDFLSFFICLYSGDNLSIPIFNTTSDPAFKSVHLLMF